MAGGKKGKAEAKSQAKGDGSKAPKGKGGKNNNQDSQKETKLKGAQNIYVKHILCDKHSRKEEALAKLRQGQDWNAVAKEYSLDKPNQGGDLRKIRKGQLLPEFEKAAFELPEFLGYTNLTYPFGDVKTSEGYHIIQVYKRE